jgi:AcrR family transcriptional regulator
MGRPAQTTDQEILQIARQTFIELGPSVSTTVIAGKLGISQATLFKRFPTKKDLLIAALSPPKEPPWMKAVLEGPDGREIPAQLHQIAIEVIDFFKTMMPCMMILVSSGISNEDVFRRFDVPPPIRAKQIMTRWFSLAMEQNRIRQTDAETLAIAFLGSVQGHVFMTHVSARHGQSIQKEERYQNAVVELFWNGIKNGDSECS